MRQLPRAEDYVLGFLVMRLADARGSFPPTVHAAPLAKANRWVMFSMPTIVQQDGFRVKVFGPPREHGPAHVHVYKGRQSVVVIRLPSPTAPLAVWAVYDMRPADVVAAFRLVEAHAETLQRAWELIHE